MVVMIAAFPPPVGGAALVTQSILDDLRASNVEVLTLDVSAGKLSHTRSAAYHAQRLRRNVSAVVRAHRRARSDCVLYIVPDGGWGAWYTLCHVLLAAPRFRRVVVHHHTARYLTVPHPAIRWLTRRVEVSGLHVFLTPDMAARYASVYGPVRHILAGNAVMAPAPAGHRLKASANSRVRVGHLSNLCEEKGFFDAVDAFEALRIAGVDATLALAGPALEPSVVTTLRRLIARYGDDVHYVGPVSGAAKNEFYSLLDVFLFPTRFAQEAAPLVCYEAMAAGVPVLATDRGLIREVISGVRGAVCPTGESFASFVVEWASGTAWSSNAVAARAASVRSSYAAERESAVRQRQVLLHALRHAVGSSAAWTTSTSPEASESQAP